VASRRHRIGVWLAWFVVLNVFWLGLVVTFNWQEQALGVLAAAFGATAAEQVQAQGLVHARIKVRWLAGLLRLPWDVVVQTLQVFSLIPRALMQRRRVEGAFRCELFPHRGADPGDEARRALYKIEASLAPNTYVVGYDDESGAMLLHELYPTGKPTT
jgi:multisubunit Na+/H+ antiporter MnhE subunit